MARRLGGVFGLRAGSSRACGERFRGGLEDLEEDEQGLLVHGEAEAGVEEDSMEEF